MSLIGNKIFFMLLRSQSRIQFVPVRTILKAFRIRRRKPIQKWFDPKDQSWAAPILKLQQERASQPEPDVAMLHMVYRIKDHFTRPYWEKDILRELELFEKQYNPVILKNTPEMNEKLRKIQHLVRIKPVTFPYGLPRDEDDYKHSYFNENGEFVVQQRIDDQSAHIEQAWAEVRMVEERSEGENIWKMDGDTIKKQCRRVLQKYKLNEEYFPEQYIYKYNQDGKEHRYTGDHNIGRHRHDWY